MARKKTAVNQPAKRDENVLVQKKDEKTRAEKFKELVEQKAHSILAEKIPAPQYLNKKIVDQKTTMLALSEMKKFKDAFNRAPTKEEINIIAESVYRQIKDETEKKQAKKELRRENTKNLLEERRKRRHGEETQAPKEHQTGQQKELSHAEQRRLERLKRRKKGLEEKEEFVQKEVEPEMGGPQPGLEEKEISEISIPDLFSDEKDDEKLSIDEITEDSEFGNLEKELEGIGSDTQSVSKDIQTDKSKCPNCRTFTQDLVYCPECGTAFCSHCAKSIQNLQDGAKFTCPKCGSSFKSKKLG